MQKEAEIIWNDANKYGELHRGSFADEFYQAAVDGDLDYFNELKRDPLYRRAAARINGLQYEHLPYD